MPSQPPLIFEGGSLRREITNSGAHSFDLSPCAPIPPRLCGTTTWVRMRSQCASVSSSVQWGNPGLLGLVAIHGHMLYHVPGPKGWTTLGSCRLPLSGPVPLGDHNSLTPSPPLPITQAQLASPASGLSSSHTGSLERCLQPRGSQASWLSGSPTALLCSPQAADGTQARGNSGSYIILMKDDAWRAYVLWQHQGSCRVGG